MEGWDVESLTMTGGFWDRIDCFYTKKLSDDIYIRTSTLLFNLIVEASQTINIKNITEFQNYVL